MKKFSVLIVLLLVAFAYGAWQVNRLVVPDTSKAATFIVKQGESLSDVARELRQEGVIVSELVFRMEARNSGVEQKIKPGTYDLRQAKTIKDIVDMLSRGTGAEDLVLVVREGWDMRDIVAELKRIGFSDYAGFEKVAGIPAKIGGQPDFSDLKKEFSFLAAKPDDVSLEGYLFPDTYRLRKDDSASRAVRRMLENFDSRFGMAERNKLASSGRTLHEVLTMASILEREVRGSRDRLIVSDLFWRRLQIGMRLQADSTVNYAIDGNKASVTLDEANNDSPWNSYRHGGLPPGPIGNPGLDSIGAALSPQPNNYLFFLTDNAGAVHYATDLDGHIRNRQLYLNK